MAEIHGIAGEWARVKGTVLGMWPLFLCVFAAGFSLCVAVLVSAGWGALLLVGSLIASGLTLMKGLRRVESFFKGARGEEKIAGILAGLPPEFHVFNDYVAGSVHIDHVVVGPSGVFAVETKFWNGEVTVEDGYVLVGGRLPSRPPLTQVRREAAQLKAVLDRAGCRHDVLPVVVFASDTFRGGSARVGDSVIMNSSELDRTIATAAASIEPDEVSRIVGIMKG